MSSLLLAPLCLTDTLAARKKPLLRARSRRRFSSQHSGIIVW